MAVLPIVKHPDKRLRVKCKKISRLDPSLQRLADDMLETLRAANGVGLAAPQVGVSLRLIVIGLPEDYDHPLAGQPIVVYNPEIVKSSGQWEPDEGCLSIPGLIANVPRAEVVTVKGRDRDGREVRFKADDLLGQAFQHEIDHLNGVLFIDLVPEEKIRRVEDERPERARRVEPTEAAAAIGS
jgi:peptide deformylase